MENKKSGLTLVLVVIIAVLCCTIGWLLGSKIGENGSVNDSTPENNNNMQDNNNVVDKEDVSNNGEGSNNNAGESTQLKNYDINQIKNIEISIPEKNAPDLGKTDITITNKEEIKKLLLNVDEPKEKGAVPVGIGFESNVIISINYHGDPSTLIILLENGNIVMNKAVGAGETGYWEYEISNKNLTNELRNKYEK